MCFDRSAVLIAGLLFAPSVLASDHSVGRLVDRAHQAATVQFGSTPGWFVQSEPARNAGLLPFIPRKIRPKIVLGETNYKLVDEHDLGPAVPPDRQIASLPVELSFRSLATSPPLRC
jgi:hypothetical protein